MGNVLKGIAGVVGKVAPIASTIASVIPGGQAFAPLIAGAGKIAQGVSNTNAQSSAQNSANGATGQQSAVGQQMANDYLKNDGSYQSALKQTAGFNPATGKYDPNYNPNASIANSLYGMQNLTGEANSIFSPGALTGGLEAHKEGTEGQYDQAVDSIKHDLSGSGFAGGNSSDSQIAGVRRGQATDNANFARQQQQDLVHQRQNYVANGVLSGKGLDVQGVNYARSQLGTLGNTLQNEGQIGAGVLGGVQNAYQNRADAIGKGNQADAAAQAQSGAGTFGTLGIPGTDLGGIVNKIFGRKKQSPTIGTTGAQSPTPATTSPYGSGVGAYTVAY